MLKDMAACEVSGTDVIDKANWKRKINKADPTPCGIDSRKEGERDL